MFNLVKVRFRFYLFKHFENASFSSSIVESKVIYIRSLYQNCLFFISLCGLVTHCSPQFIEVSMNTTSKWSSICICPFSHIFSINLYYRISFCHCNTCTYVFYLTFYTKYVRLYLVGNLTNSGSSCHYIIFFSSGISSSQWFIVRKFVLKHRR